MKTHTKRLSISTLLTIFIAVFTGNVLSSSVANANSFSLTSSSGGTLYLQSFDADKREFNYLIDTGSSLTILNKATFKVALFKIVREEPVSMR
jgi:predicted aspartyl protease